jgi:hypothetical protein
MSLQAETATIKYLSSLAQDTRRPEGHQAPDALRSVSWYEHTLMFVSPLHGLGHNDGLYSQSFIFRWHGPDLDMQLGMTMPHVRHNLLVARFAWAMKSRRLGTSIPFPGNCTEHQSAPGPGRLEERRHCVLQQPIFGNNDGGQSSSEIGLRSWFLHCSVRTTFPCWDQPHKICAGIQPKFGSWPGLAKDDSEGLRADLQLSWFCVSTSPRPIYTTIPT